MKRNTLLIVVLTALLFSHMSYAAGGKKHNKTPSEKVECRSDECEISHPKAIRIAQNYVYKAFRVKGRVKEVEYKRRYWGANCYEVEIKDRYGREYEIKINARNGKVIGSKIDLD